MAMLDERIAQHLADIGAISLEDYVDGNSPALHSEPSQALPGGNAVTQLHQACQRAFRSTDALKFEFIEQTGSRNKQCILTITKPDGVRRSYATQPVFAKKNEAKLEAARIAIDMGALEFLTGQPRPIPKQAREEASHNAGPADVMSVESTETSVDDIDKCCLEWRAGRITPHWVSFFDPKLPHKQGCALRIQLSPHVARIYLSGHTFDTHSDAKGACAKAAVLEGVLDFTKYGNGQTRPASPTPSTSSTSPSITTTPWTLQAFYDTLPKPFPESFDTDDASEINALGWLNNTVQIARGGKLVISFFFTSDGPPGLHGCLLKLDRPGEYKAFLVDAKFPKRSDAKAAVCLQAMSEGVGNYLRSIASALDNKVTSAMRSLSSSLVYPALASGLSKIDTNLRPHLEYDKERDAFGATLIVRLSTLPTPDQVRRYTVPNDYRNKADAKAAVICHAAEQGVVEFVHFRRGTPDGYVSPYTLRTYNPEASLKRKQPGSAEEAGQRPAKKKKKGKWRAEVPSHGEGSHLAPVGSYLSIHPTSSQVHGISTPDDIGQSQSVPTGGSCAPSQPAVGSGNGFGAAHPVVHPSYSGQTYASLYPAVLDPRFASGRGHDTYDGGSYPSCALDPPLLESGPSRAMPGTSIRSIRRPVEDTELEPGEVVSSAESEFSVGSSRNEEGEMPVDEPGIDLDKNKVTESASLEGSRDKGKGKEMSPVDMSTTVSRDGLGITATATVSHVTNLIDYCVRHGCGSPSFHERQNQGRFQVWIVIGNERFDLPTTYGSVEEGRQRVAKQVLARFSKGSSG